MSVPTGTAEKVVTSQLARSLVREAGYSAKGCRNLRIVPSLHRKASAMMRGKGEVLIRGVFDYIFIISPESDELASRAKWQ